MAAPFLAMDNNPPPVFDSDPKNEQWPLDLSQLISKLCRFDFTNMNLKLHNNVIM